MEFAGRQRSKDEELQYVKTQKYNDARTMTYKEIQMEGHSNAKKTLYGVQRGRDVGRRGRRDT